MLKAVKILRLVKINLLLLGKLRKNENYDIVKHYKIKKSYPTKATVMIKVGGEFKNVEIEAICSGNLFTSSCYCQYQYLAIDVSSKSQLAEDIVTVGFS